MNPRHVQRKQTTIKDIAAVCGLSAMTVSRALRSDGSASDETRQRILETAEKLGYHPRVRMGRPRLATPENRPEVEVIMGTHLQQLFSTALLVAIERELADRHYDCVIRSANGEFRDFVNLCDLLRRLPPKPTLVVGYLPLPQLRTLLDVRPQALLVDHTGDPNLDVPYASVGFDNIEAARQMTRHLLHQGRNRILLIKGFDCHYFSREQEQGYREALSQAGIECCSDLILSTDFSPQQAVGALDRVMRDGIPFDAVMSNDEMAIGLLHALNARGLTVPGDVAVGGCDGLPFGQYTIPPLTTVQLDHVALGRRAVAHILQEGQEPVPPQRIRLLPTLAVRESS